MRVLLFGTFDYLHPGHRFVIDEAFKRVGSSKLAEGEQSRVSIVVARDRNVEKIKGRVSGQNEEERARAVRAAYPQATVILGDVADFLAPVRTTKPDLILLGYDQRMPPGILESDFPCPVERLPAFQPEKFKSSLRRT